MPETTFAGDYRIGALLGRGAMASVYLAEQISTGAQRALKVLNPESLSDPKALERFEREARASSAIESDHVVRVVGAGTDEETGLVWIAQEYLPGNLLPQLLDTAAGKDALGIREIIEQLFHAMAAAHRAGIVHRDLKPENIFVAEARRRGIVHDVKVLDFGIAKMLRARDATATDAGLGTPLWTAPEQGSGDRPVDPSADVWALGLLVFRLVTGRMYWRHAQSGSSTADIAREIVEGPIAKASERAVELGSPATLAPAFDAWFARCVSRTPKKRFGDAGEAYTALIPVLGAMPMFDRRRARRRSGLRPTHAVTVLLLLVTLLLLALWMGR